MNTKREESVLLTRHKIVKEVKKISGRKVEVELFNLKVCVTEDYILNTSKGDSIETNSKDLTDMICFDRREINYTMKKKLEIDKIVFSKYSMCYFDSCINGNLYGRKFAKAINWKNLIDDLDVILHYYTRGDLIKSMDLYFEGLLDIITKNKLTMDINSSFTTNILEIIDKICYLEDFNKITKKIIIGERNNKPNLTIAGINVPEKIKCIDKSNDIYEYEIPEEFFVIGILLYLIKISYTDNNQFQKKYKDIIRYEGNVDTDLMIEILNKNTCGISVKDYYCKEIKTKSERKIQGKPLHCDSSLFYYYNTIM